MHRFTKLLALMSVLALGPCRAGSVRAASEEEEKAQTIARTDESGDFVWNGANGESMTLSIRADGFVSASRTVAEGKEGESKTTVLRKLR